MVYNNPTPDRTDGNHSSVAIRRETSSHSEAEYYEIWIKGHLEQHWSDRLGELHISYEEQGNSRLSGYIQDQAALHGILAQIRDLGLTLISLKQTNVGGNR